MAAAIIELADAVVAALNGASLGLPFTAERQYVPVHELDDLAALTVTVVPAELAMATLSRRDDEFDYAVDVAVQQSIGRGTMTQAQINAACDPLMLLTEQIVDAVRGADPGALPARFVGAANPYVFVPAHLDGKRVFTSVVRLTFKQVRQR